jgi:hypothetical protein
MAARTARLQRPSRSSTDDATAATAFAAAQSVDASDRAAVASRVREALWGGGAAQAQTDESPGTSNASGSTDDGGAGAALAAAAANANASDKTPEEVAAFVGYRELWLRKDAAAQQAEEVSKAVKEKLRDTEAALVEAMEGSGDVVLEIPRGIVDAKSTDLIARGCAPLTHYIRLKSSRRAPKLISLDIIAEAVGAVTEADLLQRWNDLKAKAATQHGKKGASTSASVSASAASGQADGHDVESGRKAGQKRRRGGAASSSVAESTKATQPQTAVPTLGDALVDLITSHVINTIAGTPFNEIVLSDTLTRGVKPFDVKPAPRGVIVLAIALHELEQKKALAVAQKKEVAKACAEDMARHAAVISAYFERSGSLRVDLRNPMDESRNLFMEPPQRIESQPQVRIKLFRSVMQTALSEMGDLRAVRDVGAAMRAKDSLLAHIRAQIAALPPKVTVEQPKLKRVPGPTAAAAAADAEYASEDDQDGGAASE